MMTERQPRRVFEVDGRKLTLRLFALDARWRYKEPGDDVEIYAMGPLLSQRSHKRLSNAQYARLYDEYTQWFASEGCEWCPLKRTGVCTGLAPEAVADSYLTQEAGKTIYQFEATIEDKMVGKMDHGGIDVRDLITEQARCRPIPM
jgi:hypothetical protein